MSCKCAVKGCKSREEMIKFCFPKPKEICRKWVYFSGNSLLISKLESAADYVVNHHKICELHFEETCFTNSNRNKLNRGSIPSLHPAVPSISSPFSIASSPSCSSIISTPLPTSRSLFPASLSTLPSSSDHHSSTSFLSPLATPLQNESSPLPSHKSFSSSESSRVKGMSLVALNMTRRVDMTPRKLKIFSYAKAKERQIKRLEKKLKELQKEKRNGSWKGIKQLEELLHSTLSSSAATLLACQLKAAGKKPKGRRWTQDEKALSLLLYKSSPKTYPLLRMIIHLPSRSTINSILHSIPFSPGVNPQIFASLSHSLGQMEDCARICVLMFDEMSIKEHCEYNASTDSVIGFEDHGHKGKSNILARYSLVFMVCGVLKKWKQPVAFYFSGSQTKSDVLVSLMEEVLQQCQEAGLRVIATVCDMGANNVKAIRSMGSSLSHPFIIFNNHFIYTLFDPPHLLKATRNLFMTHDFIIPVEARAIGLFRGTASWVHIEGAYSHAKGALLYRPLNRLTDDHIYPQGAKKMKVKLAAQVFSRSLAVYVEEGYRSGWLPSGALATSAFVGFVDEMFDSMNGRTQEAGNKPLLKGVTMESPHIEFWERAELLVQEWNMVKEAKEDTMKFSSMPPSQKGWLNNLKAFPMLCRDLLSGPDAVASSISARAFNQDPIENLFGCIRRNCGSNTRPTAPQFISSLKTSIVNGLAFSSNVMGRNCEEDDNRLLNSLRCWIDSSKITEEEKDKEAEWSGILVTNNEEKADMETSESVVAFLTTTILRNVLRSCQCGGCRLALFGPTDNDISTMYNKELCGQQISPSKELLDLVVGTMQIAERILDSTQNYEKIGLHIRRTIEDELFLDWIHQCCPEHAEELTNKILHAVLKKIIRWWCERRSRI